MKKLSTFGKDHWSTLLFLETQIVDKAFPIDMRRLRVNEIKRAFSNNTPIQWQDSYSTKLKDGSIVSGHDDIDVIDDLEEVGLIKNNGTHLNIYPLLTDKGWKVCEAIRKHKGNGGNFKDFCLSTAGLLHIVGAELETVSANRNDKRYEEPFEREGAYADDDLD